MSNQYYRGFTIVELLITIVVIGMLVGLIVAAYTNIQQRAVETVAQDNLKNLAKQLNISAVYYGIFPTTAEELDALSFSINHSALAIYPTVGANALYCTANNGADFVMLIYTITGKKLYVTNKESGEYTGSENWNANNYPGRCANILPGSASNAIPGYNINNPGDGWASWASD